MFDDDSAVMEEIKKKKELSKKTFGKIINKRKIDKFEMDDMFNG